MPLTRQRLKDLASLARRKGRAQHGLFLVEGVRSVEAAAEAGAPLVELLVTDAAARNARVAAVLRRAAVPVHILAARDLARLADVQHDQGLVAVARSVVTAAPDGLEDARAVLVLDGVQDPGNVGTLVRTAAWFGLDAVLAGPGTADVESPKAVRSAMGGLWDLRLVRSDDLGEALGLLGRRGLPVWGADLDGEPAASWAPASEGVLVLGSEAHGLSEAAASRLDGRVRIRSSRSAEERGVESLNVAMAGGILLHRWRGG